jgi:hypothetical protein
MKRRRENIKKRRCDIRLFLNCLHCNNMCSKCSSSDDVVFMGPIFLDLRSYFTLSQFSLSSLIFLVLFFSFSLLDDWIRIRFVWSEVAKSDLLEVTSFLPLLFSSLLFSSPRWELGLVVDRVPEIGARASPEPCAHFTRARASLGSSPD